MSDYVWRGILLNGLVFTGELVNVLVRLCLSRSEE